MGWDPTPTGTFEQNAPEVWPSGGWRNVNQAGASGGSYVKNGNVLWFPFTGASVTYQAWLRPTAGRVKVYVDAAYQGTFDLQHTREMTRAYSFGHLGAGAHVLRVENYRGSATVDAFQTPGAVPYYTPPAPRGITRYEEAHPAWRYNGVPYTQTVPSWSPAAPSASSDGYVFRSKTRNDTVSLTFQGTWVNIGVLGRPNGGQAEVFMDDVSQGVLDTYRATADVASFPYSNLTPGTHTLRIQVLDQRNPAATDDWVALDYLEVWDGVTAPTGRFEAVQLVADGAGVYLSRGWVAASHPAASAGDFIREGANAWFPFVGDTVSLWALTDNAASSVEVYLDEVSQGVLDLNTGVEARQAFTYTNLGAGPHVLRVRELTHARVDAFEVPVASTPITPTPSAPVRVAASKTSLGVGAVVTFSAGTVPADTQSLTWDLGDGTLISDSVEISHTYAVRGSYPVALRIVDAHGTEQETLLPVSVGVPVAPQSFVAPPEALANASPLLFVENEGQFAGGARFKVANSAQTMWLAPDGIWLTLQETPVTTDSETITVANLKLSFVNANPTPVLVPLDRAETKMSYYIGSDPHHWHADVPVWTGVRYVDLYPGLDLEISGAGGQLVWQLVQQTDAAQQTPLADVQLRIEGAENITVTLLSEGTWGVRITTTNKNFILPLLQAVTEEGMSLMNSQEVPVLQENRINMPFTPLSAMPSLEIPVDNALWYSTFFGGSSYDYGKGIAVDKYGDIYVVGHTYSSDLFTVPGLYGSNNQYDVFVAKLMADGSNILYGTFIGGIGNDYGYGIAIDQGGAIYVTGVTSSTDSFPITQGAYDVSYNDSGDYQDAFVVKLNSTFTQLEYGTYLGGEQEDIAHNIVVDQYGFAYIAGWTYSLDYPTTANAFQTEFQSLPFPYGCKTEEGTRCHDAFVTKLNADGSALEYSTFLGGDQVDAAWDITLDQGYAYVTGETNSSDFPVTADALYPIKLGGYGSKDIFVAKLATDGNQLEYSTFLGGSDHEYPLAIAVDDINAMYIGGVTDSCDYPVKNAADSEPTCNGSPDAFITKLSSDGSALEYSTYIGGNDVDSIQDLVVDSTGVLYATGWTLSQPDTFPIPDDAYDNTISDGNADAFLIKLSPSGEDVEYATYLGGEGVDKGYAIALGPMGVYIVGGTTSADFPTTTFALQNTLKGSVDGFISVLDILPPFPWYMGLSPCECPFSCVASNCQSWQGGPINTQSGNYFYSQQDMAIPVLGGNLYFERSYNSLMTDTYTTTLGYGWTHNYDVQLVFTDTVDPQPNTVVVKGCRGSRFPFTDNGDGTFSAHPGVWATLTYSDTVQRYFLRGVEQSTYVFNATGQLVEIRDAQDHAIVLTYTAGQLTQVADVNGGRYLTFSHDAQGRITALADHSGRTIGYGYDLAGDLVVVTEALSTPAQPVAWTYAYTGAHLLHEILNPAGELIERTNFDAQGRATTQWTALSSQPLTIEYGPSGVVTTTDALGRQTLDVYNARNILAAQYTPGDGEMQRTYDYGFNPAYTEDAAGNVTQATYNSMGLPESVIDAAGHPTTVAYDDRNQPLTVTDARAATTDFAYDGAQLTALTDALDGEVSHTYHDVTGLLIQTLDHGLTTTYAYNAFGQRTAVTNAQGLGTTYGYNSVGRLITTTNAQGQVSVNAYDAGDRLIAVTHNYTHTTTARHYLGLYNQVTAYAYDLAGRRILVTDTHGLATHNVYDAAGRLLRVTGHYSPAIFPAHGLDQAWNQVTTYAYDDLGRQTHITNTLGDVTYTEYDAAGRVWRTWQQYTPTHAQNWQGLYNRVTTYGYDRAGRPTHVTDTLGQVTWSEYDAVGRLVRSTQNYVAATCPAHGVANDQNLSTHYGYDAVGNQTHVTDTLGHVTYTAYDLLNRPVQVTTNYQPASNGGHYHPADPDTNLSQVTVYDPVTGRVAQTVDAAQRVTRYEYDDTGRTVAVIGNFVDGVFDAARPAEDVRQVTVYDASTGRVVQTVDAAGRVTYREYDVLGRPITVTTNYSPSVNGGRYDPAHPDLNHKQVTVYDKHGRVAKRLSIADRVIPTLYQYDVIGRLITTTNALSGTSVTAYDILGRRIATVDAEGQRATYTYDAVGRLITVTRNFEDGVFDPTVPDVDVTQVTHYDAVGRRVGQTNALQQTTTFVYDAAGRLTAQIDPRDHRATFTYDPLGRQLTRADADGVVLTTQYDALGRQTQVCDALANCTHYTYDASGQQTEMVNALGVATRYTYNAAGQLSAVTENYTQTDPGYADHQTNVQTTYIYDVSGNLLHIQDALGHTTVYTYDQAGQRVAAADPLGNVTRYSYDGQGRRVHTVHPDSSGPLVITTTYNALGWPTRTEYPDVPAPDAGLADSAGFSVDYAYNQLGQRQTVTDAVGTMTYTYDELYRPADIAAPTGAVQYTYNALGQRVNLIYPDAKVVTYTHNAAGRLTQVQDWQGQTTHYNYTDAGRLLSMQRPNDILTVYDYDAAGRLISMLHSDTHGNVIASYTYVLDALGNRVQVTDYVSPTVSSPPISDPATDISASFVLSNTTGPAPLMVTFRDTSTPGGDAWLWDFGDGHTSTARHPTHLYTQDGGFDVTLTVTYTAAPTTATWGLSQAVTVTKPVSPTQRAASAYNPETQGYLLVWEVLAGGTPAGIHGRLVAADGTQGAAFEIATGAVSQPDVAYNPDTEAYLVVWQANPEHPLVNTGNIHGRVVSAPEGTQWSTINGPGITLGNVLTFNTRATGQSPAVAYRRAAALEVPSLGHWVVVWCEQDPSTADYQVLARSVNRHQELGSAFTVANGGDLAKAAAIPAIAAGANDAFLVVWSPYTETVGGAPPPHTLFARQIDESGGLAPAFTVASSDQQAYLKPQVVYNPVDAVYLVVWEQQDLSAGTRTPHSIWARQVVDETAPRADYHSTPVQVSTVATQTQQPVGAYFAAVPQSAAAPQSTAFYLVAWAQWVAGVPNLVARRLAAPTLSTRGPFTLYTAPTAQSDVAVAVGPMLTQTLIAWTVADTAAPQQQLGVGTGVGMRLYAPLRGRSLVTAQTGYGQPLAVTFAGHATPEGLVDHWRWEFGDGATSTARNPQHTYAPGAFDVTLTVVDTDTGESAVQKWPHVITVTGRAITYTYDPLSRLVAADYQSGERYAYEYDAVGNRTMMTDATGDHTYTYDNANRLTSVDEVPYTYDARGNLISDGATLYAYNGAGRMVRAQTPSATLVYTYNAAGLRVLQAAQTYVWDWAAPVPELLTDGRYTYLVGHDTLGWEGARSPRGPVGWTYILPDALGSVRQETDATGAVTAAREWSPFGVEMGAAQGGLGFTGEWFDPGVGLTYLRARWYDGEVGRFTRVDPWWGDDEQPQSLHKYVYVVNAPLQLVDPSGEMGCPPSLNFPPGECMPLRDILEEDFAERAKVNPEEIPNGNLGAYYRSECAYWVLARTMYSEVYRHYSNTEAEMRYVGWIVKIRVGSDHNGWNDSGGDDGGEGPTAWHNQLLRNEKQFEALWGQPAARNPGNLVLFHMALRFAKNIMDASILMMPEELRGYDGFLAYGHYDIDIEDRDGGKLSKIFHTGQNVYRDVEYRDEGLWDFSPHPGPHQ